MERAAKNVLLLRWHHRCFLFTERFTPWDFPGQFQNHPKERIDRQTDHSKLLWTNLAQRIFLLKPISRLNPPPPPEMHAQELSSLRCSYKRRRCGGMAWHAAAMLPTDHWSVAQRRRAKASEGPAAMAAQRGNGSTRHRFRRRGITTLTTGVTLKFGCVQPRIPQLAGLGPYQGPN